MALSKERDALFRFVGLIPSGRTPPSSEAMRTARTEYAARPLTQQRIDDDCELAGAHLAFADYHLSAGNMLAAARRTGSALTLFEALVSDGWEAGAVLVARLLEDCERRSMRHTVTECAKCRLAELGKL